MMKFIMRGMDEMYSITGKRVRNQLKERSSTLSLYKCEKGVEVPLNCLLERISCSRLVGDQNS